MALTEVQRQRLVEDGYLQLPGMVPQERVAAALRAINSSLGDRGMAPDDLPTLRSQSYCGELIHDRAILDLLYGSGLWGLAEELVATDGLQAVDKGQIALRFPTMAAPGAVRPHLDGMYSPTNGVPKGEILNYTMLVGVMLSDVTEAGRGNLTVWPGSHRQHGAYFAEHGPQALLDGMPPVDKAPPVQLLGRAGDAVLCHYLLAHGVAPNVGPDIRYAVYFRLRHSDHDARKWDSMMDPWIEWEGLRPAGAH